VEGEVAVRGELLVDVVDDVILGRGAAELAGMAEGGISTSFVLDGRAGDGVDDKFPTRSGLEPRTCSGAMPASFARFINQFPYWRFFGMRHELAIAGCAARQKSYLSANCAIRGPAPPSPVMVPKEVLLLIGLEVLGLFKMVWFNTSKYSARNSSLVSR